MYQKEKRSWLQTQYVFTAFFAHHLERVYKAFLDADAMAKWLPPNGFTGQVHHMDARVGGTEMNIVREGLPDVIPLEACYLGWRESLTLIAKLVEAQMTE